MGHLRPSFVLLLLLGFLCVVSSNPISSLFGKSDDGKAAEEEKDVKDAAEPTTTTTIATTPATTTTSAPCSGLSGFFHLCDKNEPTEPPKKAKRDASEEDDSDGDDDSDDDSDDDDDEKAEATTASNSEAEVAKRQVGDPGAPVLGEVPPVLEDALRTPETTDGQEEDGMVKRRQVEEDGDDEEEEMEETSRRRRDCRDEDGDGGKDCRRKREYVPSCFGAHCVKEGTTAAGATETD